MKQQSEQLVTQRQRQPSQESIDPARIYITHVHQSDDSLKPDPHLCNNFSVQPIALAVPTPIH